MPILSTDLLYKLSSTTATQGNQATSTPAASLGKYISTSTIVDNTLNNLWNDITGDQNASSQVDYRCVFIHNNNASITLVNPMLWIVSTTASAAQLALAVDTTAASVIGSATAQAISIATSTTAPAGLTFSSPASKAAGIPLSNLPAGQCRAIWLRRTATNSAAVNNDTFQIRIEGDTTA